MSLAGVGPAQIAPSSDLIAASILSANGQKFVKGKPGTRPTITTARIAEGGTTSGSFLVEQAISTSTGPQGTLGSSIQMIDFIIAGTGAGSGIDIWNRYALEFTVAETGGNDDALVMPSAYAFDHIDLLFSSGTAVTTLQNGRHIEDSYLCKMNLEEWNSNYNLYGYSDPDFATAATNGFTIAAGTTQRFQLPLDLLYAWVKKIPYLGAVTTTVTLRFWTAQSSRYLYAASVSKTVTMKDIKVVVAGHRLLAGASDAIAMATRSTKTVIPSIFPIARSYNVGPVGADGLSSQITLNESGFTFRMMCDIYNAPPGAGETQITYLREYQQAIFRDIGQTIVNNYASYASQWGTLAAKLFSNVSPTPLFPLTIWTGTIGGASQVVTAEYPDLGFNYCFCDKIVDILRDETRHGSYRLRKTETLEIQATSAGYTNLLVYVYFQKAASVTLDGPTGMLSWATSQ